MTHGSSKPSIRTDAGPFALVPLWVLQRLNQGSSSGAALSVFVALHKWTNSDRYGYPSHATIGQFAGLSPATVKRGIKALEDIGSLIVVPRWIGPDGQPTELRPEGDNPERTSNGYFIRYAMPDSDPTPVQIQPDPPVQIQPDPPVQICISNKTKFELDPTELENTANAVEVVAAEIVDQCDVDFDYWYDKYPRKKSRQDAERAWKKLKPAQRQLAMNALEDHIDHWRRKQTEVEFIPYPASWLNGKRWEDELESDYRPAMSLRDQAIYAALQDRHAQEQNHETTGSNQISRESDWDDEWVG
jgi:hypothetical protein